MRSQITLKDRIIARTTQIISGITVIAVAIWGIKTWWKMKTVESTNDAQVEMYIDPLISRLTGYVREIRFEENQLVHKGDTLIIIDNSDYTVQVDAAMASADNGKAQITILDEQAAAAEKEVSVSQSQIAAAKAKLENAVREYNRYKGLYELESTTGQQLENKETALEVARAEYASSLQRVTAAEAKVSAIRSQKSAAESEINRRNAVVRQQKLNLNYTILTAPCDGQMGRRTLQTGQLVQPGQTLAYVVDLSSGKWIIANFKETQVTHMKKHEQVTIRLDALPGKEFKGQIESFSAATGARFSVMPPDNSTGNFVKTAQRIPVKIRFSPNQDLTAIAAGMNAVVEVKKIN